MARWLFKRPVKFSVSRAEKAAACAGTRTLLYNMYTHCIIYYAFT